MEMNEDLLKEVLFLRERNRELRQKTWYSVFEENLKLIETVNQLNKELKQCGQVADNFYMQGIELQRENQHLKRVIQSVETFIAERTK